MGEISVVSSGFSGKIYGLFMYSLVWLLVFRLLNQVNYVSDWLSLTKVGVMIYNTASFPLPGHGLG